jgi:drug/metabolite transporter (DMT)-like permease
MDNLRGAALMVLAMLGFAVEDMMIKVISGQLPIGQIIGMLGVGGALVFGTICKMQGRQLLDPTLLTRAIAVRNIAELIGTLGFVTAIVLTPISTASAILQATPLIVTFGAAVFFGETVGWRRWSAIGVGFLGVMLIIRPGTEGFNHLSIVTLIGVFGLAMRDLATRSVPKETSSMQLSFLAFLTLIPTAFILSFVFNTPWHVPTPKVAALLVASIVVAVLAYYAIVAAMRVGEISFVTPFRYTRLVFALIIGVLVFGEQPDLLTLIGSAIVVLSGIYTVLRERRLKRQATL